MSRGFLLDTNCISEVALPNANTGVTRWFAETPELNTYLSVLTVGEIRKGIEKLAHGRRRVQLEQWLNQDLRIRFSLRLLSIDEAIAERWGILDTNARKRGRSLPVIDGLLAATALEHNLTLVTRNTRDFEAIPVSVVSPWEP